MAISDAIGSERISRILGYKMTTGNFANQTPNLPQRIAIIGEANTANQATFPTGGTEILSAQEAGTKYGYGSPIYNMMRILRPVTSDGVGGIPTVVYAQAEAGGAVARLQTVTVTGTVTANATHTVNIAGRGSIDGDSYSFTVSVGDSVTAIASAINVAINNVLGSPVTSTAAIGVVTATAKWKGLTSQDITITVDTGDNAAGITYTVAETAAGSGVPTVTTSLNLFNNDWNTIVVNAYGIDSTAVLTELESFNGIPDPSTPTGRFQGIIMKPFIALTGSINDEDTVLTDSKKGEVTIAVCPAPLSPALPMEAAANMAVLFARIEQDSPHLDVAGRSYPDMPVATAAITMNDYSTRDAYVKKGNSTVDINNGKYRVQDFVTTYHPIGEAVPQYRYARNLMIDFNVKFSYRLLEEINVVDHAIADDNDTVTVGTVIKPKEWKGIVYALAEDLAKRALIAQPSFMQDSIVVGLSTSNPDRLETFFRYKRTGFTRVAATTAEAGFNFG